MDVVSILSLLVPFKYLGWSVFPSTVVLEFGYGRWDRGRLDRYGSGHTGEVHTATCILSCSLEYCMDGVACLCFPQKSGGGCGSLSGR